MSDKGLFFLFSLAVIVASLAAAGYLLATGQAGTVDGLFLLLTCLLIAFAFSLYVMYVIRHALEPAEPVKSQQPKPATPAAAQKTTPVAAAKTE
jgi:hypothetical protein